MTFSLQQRPFSEYRGRFAPSPSGFLHFGSLVAALASYLDAKSHHGKWLVRIEDIDPPREQVGASKAILKTLEAYGLHWDETELYQSNQATYYQQILEELAQAKLSYNCQCTRAEIKKMGGVYSGKCRTLDLTGDNLAVRVINSVGIDSYQDLFQGHVQCDPALSKEDFIVLRKDGLFAYQLAVVLDEIFQGITHVIRGCDLLEPTVRQLSFFKILHCQAPVYGHVPLAITDEGYKLSKQNKAPALNDHDPMPSLLKALTFLGHTPEQGLSFSSPSELLNWATLNWQRDCIPKNKEIML